MFTKLANEIDFSDIEAFCREWGEGVRVEYKSKTTTESLRKTISSFANTQGGILIIGVDADKECNKARFPIQGIPNDGGIEEWIVQSATDGIYPSILPEVIICDVPGETGNVVVVVRVEESQQAPHAIQNTDRLYIRVASVTQPHKPKDESKIKDAGIDRIEYLLKRREEPQRITRQILERIEERVRNHCSHLDAPNLELIARPVFPYRPVITAPEIHEYMVLDPAIPTTDRNIDLMTRRVTGGVRHVDDRNGFSYTEWNEYGIFYRREILSWKPWLDYNTSSNSPVDTGNYLDADDIAASIFKHIGTSKYFLQRCKYFGNIEISVRIFHIYRRKLKFPYDQHPIDTVERESAESEVAASIQCLPRDLIKADSYAEILMGLLADLFWVFNVCENQDQWRSWWRKYVAEKVGR